MHSATSPSARRTGEVQCLRELPWDSRATALGPDSSEMGAERPQFKRIGVKKIDQTPSQLPRNPVSFGYLGPGGCRGCMIQRFRAAIPKSSRIAEPMRAGDSTN